MATAIIGRQIKMKQEAIAMKRVRVRTTTYALETKGRAYKMPSYEQRKAHKSKKLYNRRGFTTRSTRSNTTKIAKTNTVNNNSVRVIE